MKPRKPAPPSLSLPLHAPSKDEPIEPDKVERPKLRIVHSQPEEEVVIEPSEDGRFFITLIKHDGGTRLGIYYTRKQLEMLQRRIGPALEMSPP